MKVAFSQAHRAIAIGLCTALLIPFYPLRVAANDGPKVIIEIGQPSVWSLGQAHYLLAKMHRRDRKLNTRFPDENDLDSNRISATRIDALRQSIGVEGQFDQAMGVKNDLALQRFREGEVRRETARADLLARQKELQTVNGELADINEQIAVMTEEDRQSKEARDRETPPAAPTTDDNERRKELARLGVRKTRKEEERTELKSQITSLTTTADTPTAAPTFEEPALTTGTGTLPNPATFQKFMDKALAEAGKPELSASMKLDNFVNMQYEIISKQLTLLRDEVGPDDRVIFLELPASLYTVDGKANDYIAQVEWKVKTYCDQEPPAEIQEAVIREILQKEGRPDVEDTLLRIEKVRDIVIKRIVLKRLTNDISDTRDDLQKGQMSPDDIEKTINHIIKAQEKLKPMKTLLVATNLTEKDKLAQSAELARVEVRAVEKDVRDVVTAQHGASPAPYPITLEMIKRHRKSDSKVCSNATTEQVRAIDVIPRQSALNVNEYHATVNETKILAAFKWLIGFAVKVDFQRQRELYEQFVQQQVFASGYGKGSDKFGWTYGPQPGTKRIAPGLRTTFAVLVVPRNTLAVELKAGGRYYKRNKSPQDPDSGDVKLSGGTDFLLSVPGKRTQEFWVDGISYTPVRKGKRVTAVIDGNYFSPQLGIMVNGVPLEPVVSISRAAGGDEEADVQSADGVVGEYEITNSRQIALSFSMGDSYIGTPNITFTSPEKSTSINFFDLDINHRGFLSSLQEKSVREPMFIEDFNDKMEIEVIEDVPVVVKSKPENAVSSSVDTEGEAVAIDAEGEPGEKETPTKFKLVRIKGAGMRPGAQITLNDSVLDVRNFAKLSDILKYVRGKPTPLEPFVAQDSTKSYILYFPEPKGEKWRIGYRHLTRQGYEEGSAAKDLSPPPTFSTTVRNYRFDPAMRRGEVDLTFTSDKEIEKVFMDEPTNGTCQGPKPAGKKQYRVKCFVQASNGGKMERDFFTVRLVVKDEGVRYEDIRLTVRPLVTSVINPRTGYPAGFTDEEPTIVITGINLQGITSIFFGDKEAKIIGKPSSDAVAVKVPKGAAVSKGQAAAVPVIFQTAGGQQVPSGAVYTYLGEPLPPNVIVWPPSVSGKLP
jgi:hypothetical protein